MPYQFSRTSFVVNPYTFAKGNRVVKRSEKESEVGTHTGVFTCRLYPKTPLLIPDAMKKQEIPGREEENIQHYSYPFFRLGEEPVIPGSSLRGPLRSMYEALTDSCYSTARPEQYITARAKQPFEPGILVHTSKGWGLFSATRYLLPIEEYGADPFPGGTTVQYKDVVKKYGYEVTFAGGPGYVTNRNGQSIPRHLVQNIASEEAVPTSAPFRRGLLLPPGMRVGYYYIGEYISRKKYESIFVPNARVPLSSAATREAFEHLKEVQRVYQDEKVNQKFSDPCKAGDKDQHGGYLHVDLKKFEEASMGVLPIWYKETGGQYYFSLANIGRFQYKKSLDDILGKGDTGRMPCSSIKKLCKACSLFGMVGEEEGLGSSVRITDAVFEGAVPQEIPSYNLTELRTPHPSYLPFYAVTNDYLAGYDDRNCTIRGRKFYWHSTPDYTALSHLSAEKIDAKMEGLGEQEGSFRFKVYFEKLTGEQLWELAMLLCLGENKKEGRLCFKLGHGKPLGFGSAKIVVDKLEIRKFDSAQPKYTIKEYELGEKLEDWEFLKDVFEKATRKVTLNNIRTNINDMAKILSFNFNADGNNRAQVVYPNVLNRTNMPDDKLNENDLASSQWFSLNWKFGSDNPSKILPRYEDENQTLPSAEFRIAQGAGGRGNRRR